MDKIWYTFHAVFVKLTALLWDVLYMCISSIRNGKTESTMHWTTTQFFQLIAWEAKPPHLWWLVCNRYISEQRNGFFKRLMSRIPIRKRMASSYWRSSIAKDRMTQRFERMHSNSFLRAKRRVGFHGTNEIKYHTLA